MHIVKAKNVFVVCYDKVKLMELKAWLSYKFHMKGMLEPFDYLEVEIHKSGVIHFPMENERFKKHSLGESYTMTNYVCTPKEKRNNKDRLPMSR